jgi:hypothetical protein
MNEAEVKENLIVVPLTPEEVAKLQQRVVELEKKVAELTAAGTYRVAFALSQAIGTKMIVAWMITPNNRFIKQFWLYDEATEKLIKENQEKSANEWNLSKRIVPNMNDKGIYFINVDRRFLWGNMKYDVNRGIIMEGFIEVTKKEFDLIAEEFNANDWQDFDDETWCK